jgi:pyruvate dehydrogenase E2 component (dihydrolipoamide acetyltransferase)
MIEFKLPDVGEGIHEAEIVRWLVQVGEMVSQDQPMVEIQTDKAVVEIPSPAAGWIAEIRAQPGSVAHVGDILVAIEAEQPATARPMESEQPVDQPPKEAQPPVATPKVGLAAGAAQRVLAAPIVRRLARELEIDLAEVPGSGPAGRVLPGDVRQFAEQRKKKEAAPSPPAPLRGETEALQLPPAGEAETSYEEPLQGLRRRIAERMEAAWQIPQVTAFDEVEVASLAALRRGLQPAAEGRGVHLTYLPFIIKAVVQTLKAFPYFNASLDMKQQKITRHPHYHIGIATAVSDGLLVPVIRHADRFTLLQLAAELSRLAEGAQERRLTPAELSGSTFTITNFGSFGMRSGTPLLNPPEVAILGCGRIEEKPVASQGQLEIRPVLPLALTFDHRLLDGAAAAKFLEHLKTLVADPNLLFLEMV